MKQRKPRIGVLAVGRSTFDVEFAQSVFEQAWQALQRLDAALVGEPRIHYEADAALAAFATLKASDIDLLLVVQVTFTDAAVVTAIAAALDVPLVLWTFPEARTGGRLRLNSFCGANLASHTLSRRGASLENVHGAPDSADALASDRGGREGRDDRAAAEGPRGSSSSATIRPASTRATTRPTSCANASAWRR